MRLNFYSLTLQKILNKWPGEKYLGVYRFLPFFFILGATLEFSMINWRVGNVNFYDTFKRRRAKDLIEAELREQNDLHQIQPKNS